MRVFILVALLAMAATVSCQDIVVSPACNSSSNALETPAVDTAENAIVKGGCAKVEFSLTSGQCTFDNATSIYNCKCDQTLTNTDAWETAVRNVSGQPCYLALTFTLTGTVKVDNTTAPKPFTFNSTQTNYQALAVGGSCNQTEIGAVFAAAVNGGAAVLADPKDALNANSATTGVTWTTGFASVTGCGVQRTSSVVNIPQPSTGTTAPPAVTTSPPTTGSNTTAPPAGTTAPPKSGDASVIASSAALVASLIAALAILA